MPGRIDLAEPKSSRYYQNSSHTDKSMITTCIEMTCKERLLCSWVTTIVCSFFVGGVTLLSVTSEPLAARVTMVSVGAGMCAFGCVASVASYAVSRLCSNIPSRSGYENV